MVHAKTDAFKILMAAMAAVLFLTFPLQAAAASVSDSDFVCYVETKSFKPGEPNDPVIWYYEDVPAVYANEYEFTGTYKYTYKNTDFEDVNVSGTYRLGSAVSAYCGQMYVNFHMYDMDTSITRVNITYETNIFETGLDLGAFTFQYDVDGSDEWVVFEAADLGTSGTNTISFDVNLYDGFIDGQFHFWLYDQGTNPLLEFGIKSITFGDPAAEEEDTTKNIFELLQDFFGNFFDRLGDFLLGLIVPDSEELSAFLEEVNTWFSDRLGFIWYPFDLAIDLVSALAGGEADTAFKIPGFTLNILGGEYTIWEETEVDIDPVGLFKYVRVFTSFILASGVVNLAINKYNEWIGGHNVA